MANGAVIPKRLSVSPADATKAPIAMRMVAGTRLWSSPASKARTAPGSDATKLTVSAKGAIRRLNRNWSPDWPGSREYARTRRFGMNTYAENNAPKPRLRPPVTFRKGVRSRSVPGNRVATGCPVSGLSANGSASAVVAISPMDRTVAPTIPIAAIRGQRSFWK